MYVYSITDLEFSVVIEMNVDFLNVIELYYSYIYIYMTSIFIRICLRVLMRRVSFSHISYNYCY